jgi:hypothetical protein
MAADPEHYSKLVASVAPRVIDMDSVKAGLLCQLFGGVSKSTAAALGGNTTSRCAGAGSRVYAGCGSEGVLYTCRTGHNRA